MGSEGIGRLNQRISLLPHLPFVSFQQTCQGAGAEAVAFLFSSCLVWILGLAPLLQQQWRIPIQSGEQRCASRGRPPPMTFCSLISSL